MLARKEGTAFGVDDDPMSRWVVSDAHHEQPQPTRIEHDSPGVTCSRAIGISLPLTITPRPSSARTAALVGSSCSSASSSPSCSSSVSILTQPQRIRFSTLVAIGIIYAVANVEVTLNVLAEFVGGAAYPGNYLAMLFFKTYGQCFYYSRIADV